MSAEVASEGLGGRLVKLGRILGLGEGIPVAEVAPPLPERETEGARASREIERRRALYEDVGRFLFAHDLDLTPLNFGLALDYITGNDLALEKAVRAILADKGQLSNGLAEQIIAKQRSDELTPDALNAMLSQMEDNLSQLTGIADQSSNSAKDFGAACRRKRRNSLGRAAGATRSAISSRSPAR